MSIIPDFVLTVVNSYLDPLLAWFSDQMYARLLQGLQQHFLVRLRAHLDLAPLEQACADFHHSQGPGAPPTHPVPRLVRALLAGYLFDCSLRQLEAHIRFNLLIKWFVGYHLFQQGPDHSTLERFELWVCEQQHRTFFDQVLAQIDRDLPEERLKPQIGDTFAMQANAAKESTIRLIRHTAQCLLKALAAADPAAHSALLAQLDTEALLGSSHEAAEFRLSTAEQRARLQATARAAQQCLALLKTHLNRTPGWSEQGRETVKEWLARLEKVLHDELEITAAEGQPAAKGQPTQPDDPTQFVVTPRTEREQGAYALGSATDPDATFRVHGDNLSDLGYNIQLATTDHFIREIQANTGAQPDAASIPDILVAQREREGAPPPKLIYDAAAGQGKTFARVHQATNGQTQLVAPLVPYARRSDRFAPEEFTPSADHSSLTCPNGVISTTAYRSGSGEGLTFRFSAKQCAGCPLCSLCRDPDSPPSHMRQVFISDYRPYLEAAKAYQRSEEYKADMKLRPLIERFVFMLTNYDGARRARRRGEKKADFQAKMCATARNLRQWLGLLEKKAAQASAA